MNLKEIKEMINLMNEHDLSEVEVEREGNKIKLRKSSADTVDIVRHRPSELNVAAISPPSDNLESSSGPKSKISGNLVEITSPMVGTFYRAPSPESAPFVEAGQTVEIGQVVCIVEAMKLMNEIKSEIRGKVVEIAVENAEPVEFGQALFGVEPL